MAGFLSGLSDPNSIRAQSISGSPLISGAPIPQLLAGAPAAAAQQGVTPDQGFNMGDFKVGDYTIRPYGDNLWQVWQGDNQNGSNFDLIDGSGNYVSSHKFNYSVPDWFDIAIPAIIGTMGAGIVGGAVAGTAGAMGAAGSGAAEAAGAGAAASGGAGAGAGAAGAGASFSPGVWGSAAIPAGSGYGLSAVTPGLAAGSSYGGAAIGGGLAGSLAAGEAAGAGSLAGQFSPGGNYFDPTGWGGGVPEGGGYGLSANTPGLTPMSTYGGEAIGSGLGAAPGGGGFWDYIRNGASNLIGNGGDGGTNWLGLGATALGALGGAQGQSADTSATRQLPAYLQGPVANDLVPRAQGLLSQQMPGAMQAGQQLTTMGSGLLGQTAPTTASNPYLSGIADDMQRRTQDLLGQNNLAIQGNFVGSGGLGGSRQGVAQGVAAGKAADYLQGNVANLYGGAYNADQNRLRQDWTIGSGLLNQGLNTPYQPLKNTSEIFQPYTGFGTTSQNQSSGGGWQGGVGGALAGASLGRQMGWW